MRFYTIFGAVLAVATAFVHASPTGDPAEPEVLVVAAFPEENPFGHIVNGEKNKMLLLIENKSDKNITLMNVGGSVLHPDTDNLIKNTSTLSYGIPLLEGAKLQIPYTFHSEFKPGDHRLTLWLDHAAEGTVYRVSAYDAIITVVEPELSIFDLKLLSTYLLTALLLAGLGYAGYATFVPQPKKKRPTRVSEPVQVTATGAGGYQEEWIPEHHLKKPKAAKRTKSQGGATSGEE